MDFVEIQVTCNSDYRKILIAEMGEMGFDSMLETDSGFCAYISKKDYKASKVSLLIDRYGSPANLKCKYKEVKRRNWNEEWEKNFDPVLIGNKCLVRSSFHAPHPEIPIEIIIDPKMSFGTGHHATTSLMIECQLEIDHKGKAVLDCGCGTGVLSILAQKLGASKIIGFDIDDWAIENAQENARLNGITGIKFLKGTIREVVIREKFDIILANINKNILLDDIMLFTKALKPSGNLLLSGFYAEDLKELKEKSTELRLDLKKTKINDNWIVAQFSIN